MRKMRQETNITTRSKSIKKAWQLCIIIVVVTSSSSSVADSLSVLSSPILSEQHPLTFSLSNKIEMQNNIVTSPHSMMSNGIILLSLLVHEEQTLDDMATTKNSLGSTSTTAMIASTSANNNNKLERDEVERILDANTVILKKKGVVRLAGVRMPSVTSANSNDFQFPPCFAYSPLYKIRQLLPYKTVVQIQTITSNSSPPQVVLVRNKDSLILNQELVKTGFARVIKQQRNSIETSSSLLDIELLLNLQAEAQSNGLGIFSKCDDNDTTKMKNSFEAEFEPLERSMETIYMADGGRQQLRTQNSLSTFIPPNNPGDIKGCSDFGTYEEALEWFETYKPYYGDVAKLDRDGDGVPCPGLPHTNNRERYRMKIPKKI